MSVQFFKKILEGIIVSECFIGVTYDYSYKPYFYLYFHSFNGERLKKILLYFVGQCIISLRVESETSKYIHEVAPILYFLVSRIIFLDFLFT